MTLQLTKDGVLVLYRPSTLEALTIGKGPISAYTLQELSGIDAGWCFGGDKYLFRGKNIGISTLEQALVNYPSTFFYLDIKSPDADPIHLAPVLTKVLKKTNSLNHVRVYPTEANT